MCVGRLKAQKLVGSLVVLALAAQREKATKSAADRLVHARKVEEL